MNIQLDSMCDWERSKAIYLLHIAQTKLGMDTSGYGELAVNSTSGYTYLWLEDYPFTLYMPINCELELTDVMVMCTDIEDGTEHKCSLAGDDTIDTLTEWCDEALRP